MGTKGKRLKINQQAGHFRLGNESIADDSIFSLPALRMTAGDSTHSDKIVKPLLSEN